MLPRDKRKSLTIDDLMRRQESGSRKRQKRVRDEESLEDSDSSDSGEDLESVRSSPLYEDEDDQGSASETPTQGEEDTTASRFSFKPRQNIVTEKNAVPSHVSSLPQTFVKLGVSSPLVSAVNKMSIYTPTDVQVACIPPLLDGMYSPHSVLCLWR